MLYKKQLKLKLEAESFVYFRLVDPLTLVDLRNEAERDRDYLATEKDILGWEKKFGKVKKGSVVRTVNILESLQSC